MQTFRVDGHLFRLLDNGELQFFVENFDPVTGLNGINGMSGFFKSLGKIVKKVWKPVAVVAAGYYGYKAVTGSAISLPTIGKTIAAITPSASTVLKAAGIATTLLTASIGAKQSALQLKYGAQPVETVLTPPENGGYPMTAENQYKSDTPAGYQTGLSTNTIILLGGGALVLIMMLGRKK